MRAHWFDIGIIAIVIFLEIKGFFPRSVFSHLPETFFASHSFVAHQQKVPSKPIPTKQAVKVAHEQVKMSSAIKNLVQQHIASNKVAVLIKTPLHSFF